MELLSAITYYIQRTSNRPSHSGRVLRLTPIEIALTFSTRSTAADLAPQPVATKQAGAPHIQFRHTVGLAARIEAAFMNVDTVGDDDTSPPRRHLPLQGNNTELPPKVGNRNPHLHGFQ